MSSARKKEKHRLKKLRQKREHRRHEAAGPYRALARGPGLIESCLVNADWRAQGEAGIYIICRMPGHGFTLISFLVDLWCIGLKDAFGRMGVTPQEFEERMESSGLDLVEMDVAQAAALVAGAVRHSRQHGFKLPHRFERWAAVLGPLDFENADTSLFGRDGKLFYVGSMTDLRNRLIGRSVQEFMSQPDVEIGSMEGPVLDDGEAFEIEDDMAAVGDDAVDRVRQWCFAHGEPPHPDLPAAMDVMIEAALQSGSADAEDSDGWDRNVDAMNARVKEMLAMEAPGRAQGLMAAMMQLGRFADTFDNPADFLADVLGEDAEELDAEAEAPAQPRLRLLPPAAPITS